LRTIGDKGEDIAIKFLKKQGYLILEKNYRTILGEVDIIAKDNETIVFVEVKTRTNLTFGYPFEAINNQKIQKLKKVALSYLKRHNLNLPIRFDILSIFLKDKIKEIHHIKDAFEV
jgi:putative endonuclease